MVELLPPIILLFCEFIKNPDVGLLLFMKELPLNGWELLIVELLFTNPPPPNVLLPNITDEDDDDATPVSNKVTTVIRY